MVPISLKIKGVFSYIEEQNIDFTKLLSNQVFGVFGDVGSGKSAILDSITYVLYKKTGKDLKKMGYDIMNLKSNSFLIDFEFSSNNKNYRFVSEGKRNSKKFEDVKPTNKQYEEIDGNWVANELDVEEVIGLSYDNFKRTIIIPQGKFMEFMQIGETERTKMLKDIFGLNKYSLSGKLSLLNKENDASINIYDGNLLSYVDCLPEDISIYKEDIKGKEIVLNKDKIILKSKKSDIERLESLRKDFDDYKKLCIDFEKLEADKTKNKDLEVFLVRYDSAFKNFKSLLDAKNTLAIDISKIHSSIDAVKEVRKGLVSKISTNDIDVNKYEEDYNKLDISKAIIQEYNKVISIKSTEAEIVDLDRKLELSNKELSVLETSSSDINKEQDIEEKQLSVLEDNSDGNSSLSNLMLWYSNYDKIQQDIKIFKGDFVKKKEEISDVINRKVSVFTEAELKTHKIELSSITDMQKSCLDKREGYKVRVNKLEEEEKSLSISEKLKEYSSALETGKACMLCGSKDHPRPVSIADVSGEISEKNKQIKKGELYIDFLDAKYNDLERLKAEYRLLKKDSDNLEQKASKKEMELKEYINTFTSGKYKIEDRDKIVKASKESEKTAFEIKKHRISLSALKDKLKQISTKLEIDKEVNNTLKNKISIADSSKKILISQLDNLTIESFEGKSKQDIESLKAQESAKVKNTEEKYNYHHKIKEELEKEKLSNTVKHDALQSQSKDKEKDVLDNKTRIIDSISKSEFDQEKEIIDVLDSNIDIERTRKELLDFNIDYEKTKELKKVAFGKVEGKEFDDKVYSDLFEELKNLDKELEDKVSELAVMIKKLSDLKIKLKEKAVLEKELKKLKLRQDNLKVLKSLFTAEGFVNFVSRVYLQQLVNSANERFYNLTDKKLSLELDDKNNFNVIDYMNGGKRRSARTLSGGQMFQASLTLALSLAGSVNSKSKENFFFLDEGFGTQDAKSLKLIFDTIESLKAENRKIGLISHVEELKEQVSVYLNISNADDKGSFIKPSYEIV